MRKTELYSPEFKGFAWYLIHKIRKTWGYQLDENDCNDLLQAASIAAWQSRELSESDRLKDIESNIIRTEIHTQGSTQELTKAGKDQNMSRNRLCCLMTFLGIVLAVVIIILVT